MPVHLDSFRVALSRTDQNISARHSGTQSFNAAIKLRPVSFDLYFWPSGAATDPRRLGDRLADERAESLTPDERVLTFRAELLRRWPELADRIFPWHPDLAPRRPWGRADLADRFVGLSLPSRWPATDALPVLAGAYGLDCYDPQVGALTHHRPRALASVATGNTATTVAGWVSEDHVVRLLRQVSSYIGYAYDDLDEAALTGALDDTDDESPDGWFDYPLEGTPPLLVRLARSAGSTVVSVRFEGTMDLILATRLETVLDML